MITDTFTSFPVEDFDTASAWYEIFFGRGPDFCPKPDEAVWRIAGSGWLAVVVDEPRSGSGLLTLLVDSLENHVGFLAMRGIAPESIETVPDVVRRAKILDPAGNTITIGQSLAPAEPPPGDS
ncbi:MAG: VOC family protein [Solirubrobacterales bacterium]|nr:VOC family protein [Solirubrobacterales bacterium]